MGTMSWLMLLIFLLCIGIDFLTLRNQSKHQKGLLLGVTLPPEADALPEVQAIVKQYRTQLGTLCLVCAVLSVPLAFVQETAIALTLWMLFFFAGLALPYLPLLRANAKLKALKKAHGWQGNGCRVVDTAVVADEDDVWVGGLFYYDPTDKRFMVSKRLGIGTTVNLGTLAGKIYMGFVALVLVAVLAIGPIFGIVDSIPVRLELSGNAPVCLVASHGQSEKYRLATDTITDVQLRDTLPDTARTWGVGMDHYLQGDFYVTGEGNARFCLDPTKTLFLRVEAGGQVYWFTGNSEEETSVVAAQLKKNL